VQSRQSRATAADSRAFRPAIPHGSFDVVGRLHCWEYVHQTLGPPSSCAAAGGVHGRRIARGTAAVCVVVALLLATARAPAPAAAIARAPGALPCPGATAMPSAATLDATAAAVVCLVNAHRVTQGRRRLRPDPVLVTAAVRHSLDMIRRGYFGHVTPTGAEVADRIHRAGYFHAGDDWVIGEDLAWGTGALATPQATVAAWIASPSHERVLLSSDFVDVGVGVALGAPFAAPGTTAATYTLDVGETSRPS
jgi:uncharacterized protein YkwD